MPHQIYYSPLNKQSHSKISLFCLDFIIGAFPSNLVNIILNAPYSEFRLHLLKNPNTTTNTFFKFLRRYNLREAFISVQLMPKYGVYYALKEIFRITNGTTIQNGGHLKWALSNIANGFFAGYVTLMLLYGVDVPHVVWVSKRVQLQKSLKSQLTGFSKYKQFLLRFVVGSMYKGFFLASISTSIYRGLYYGIFDTVKVYIPNSFLLHTIVCSLSSLAGFLASSPITRVIRQSVFNKQIYPTKLACAKSIFEKQGLKGFFYGINRNISQSLFAGITLASIEKLQFFVYTRYHQY